MIEQAPNTDTEAESGQHASFGFDAKTGYEVPNLCKKYLPARLKIRLSFKTAYLIVRFAIIKWVTIPLVCAAIEKYPQSQGSGSAIVAKQTTSESQRKHTPPLW